MNIIIFSAIGVLAFYGAIKIVSKDEESNIKMEREVGIILFIFISTSLSYLKYKLTLDFFFIFYLFIYLIICAYIDKKTMYVYSIFNYATIIISIFYLILKSNNTPITNIVINVIIYSIFAIAMGKLNFFGEGDSEILISIAFFIAIKYQYFPLEALFFNIILANIILIITNISNFNFKNFKFKSKIAYAPSIALSTIIMILI